MGQNRGRAKGKFYARLNPVPVAVESTPEDCKVVFGCGAMGYSDVTRPMSHEDCVQYIREHRRKLALTLIVRDPHYTDSLEIMDVETGHLMSFKL